LRESLPASSLTLVQQFAAQVRRAHDEVRSLRNRQAVTR
jgi:hypothetical protein